eukprot:gnl/Hemi2/19003_TR6285_c0_g1_i1.p2 gnl/Hemi2/19003_TR6285_c0_g1~~gnl/Hemi2/19003_TR6285_c0_g1_i1.p2  ORF type:complete len:158 (-),score=60.80 gnl/Hemi2/19003_TR6285_c0_g1_i1:226-699(-)
MPAMDPAAMQEVMMQSLAMLSPEAKQVVKDSQEQLQREMEAKGAPTGPPSPAAMQEIMERFMEIFQQKAEEAGLDMEEELQMGENEMPQQQMSFEDFDRQAYPTAPAIEEAPRPAAKPAAKPAAAPEPAGSSVNPAWILLGVAAVGIGAFLFLRSRK